MKYDNLIPLAIEAGAVKAAIISNEDIVLSSEFRNICSQNTCGCFNRCWMCPPFIGEINSLMEKIRQYPQGLIYQTISEIEDSFDIEGMLEAGKRHIRASHRIQEALLKHLPQDYLHLSKGGCGLCKRCAKLDDLPCRFPEKAMASLEGYGIDVYQTSLNTNLKYSNGQNTVTYFGLILFKGD